MKGICRYEDEDRLLHCPCGCGGVWISYLDAEDAADLARIVEPTAHEDGPESTHNEFEDEDLVFSGPHDYPREGEPHCIRCGRDILAALSPTCLGTGQVVCRSDHDWAHVSERRWRCRRSNCDGYTFWTWSDGWMGGERPEAHWQQYLNACPVADCRTCAAVTEKYWGNSKSARPQPQELMADLEAKRRNTALAEMERTLPAYARRLVRERKAERATTHSAPPLRPAAPQRPAATPVVPGHGCTTERPCAACWARHEPEPKTVADEQPLTVRVGAHPISSRTAACVQCGERLVDLSRARRVGGPCPPVYARVDEDQFTVTIAPPSARHTPVGARPHDWGQGLAAWTDCRRCGARALDAQVHLYPGNCPVEPGTDAPKHTWEMRKPGEWVCIHCSGVALSLKRQREYGMSDDKLLAIGPCHRVSKLHAHVGAHGGRDHHWRPLDTRTEGRRWQCRRCGVFTVGRTEASVVPVGDCAALAARP